MLQWVLSRCRGESGAQETALGLVPTYGSFDWDGLDFPRSAFEDLHAIDTEEWLEEDAENKQFLAQFGSRLPRELLDQHAERERRLRGFK